MNPNPKFTLEDIAKRKAEVLQELRVRQQTMLTTARRIAEPLETVARQTNSLVQSFHTGMALFNGVRLGMKFIKKASEWLSGLRTK